MDKISLLSREQEKKKVFFQLGKRFGLLEYLEDDHYNIVITSYSFEDIWLDGNYYRDGRHYQQE